MPPRRRGSQPYAKAKAKAAAEPEPPMCLAEVNPNWLTASMHAWSVWSYVVVRNNLSDDGVVVWPWIDSLIHACTNGAMCTEDFWADDPIYVELAPFSSSCWVLHLVSHCQHWSEVAQKRLRSSCVVMLHLVYHSAQDEWWLQGDAGWMFWAPVDGVFSSVFDFWLT